MDQDWVEKLCDWIPGPQSLLPPDDAALAKTQQKLRITLPSDFVSLCRHYGPGQFCAREVFGLILASPFTGKLLSQQEYLHEDLESYVDSGNETEITVYPHLGGLLPFAWSNAVHFTWRTNGSPKDWPIVVIWDYEVGGYNQYDMGCCEFLWKFLRRDIFVNPFRDPWDPQEVYFQGAHDPLLE